MPELSIVVTTYNIEAYVEQCLASVAAQTLTDFEVLVVDDGSSDATPARITDFCAGDPRFVPVLLPTNSPGGVATAANAGIDRATGRWLGFVDGDDYVEPTMFERLVDAATAHDADLAMCEYQEVVDGTGERHDPADAHRWGGLTESAYELDVETRKRFLRFVAVPWRKLYRRSLLDEQHIRFPVGEGFYEDNPFHWFALLGARSIAVVPEVLCYHRVGRSGQTMATADERLFQIFAHHDTIHAWLETKGLLDVYDTTLLGWVVSQMEWISRRTPPALQRRLFDTLVPIFARYSPTTLAAALREGNKGATTQRMSAAIAKREFGSFARRLSARPGSDNPLVTAAFHLRHSGVQHTAVLTGRYVRNAVSGRRLGRVVALGRRFGRHEPTRQDLMFGLVALQHRLQGLDDHLVGIDARLAELAAQGAQEGRGREEAADDQAEPPVDLAAGRPRPW